MTPIRCRCRWHDAGAVGVPPATPGKQAAAAFALLAAACGTFIACAVCVLFVMAYAYVYLAHHDW